MYREIVMRILSIFGTRPEAIKMAPVVQALQQAEDMESIVCVTGQHRDMLDQVLQIFAIQPDEDLNLMKPNQSLHELTARIIQGLQPIFSAHKPDAVLVHGDTTTCLAASLAAFYSRIPIGHVEAGLRTYNLDAPFPEEGNRQLTDRLSQWCFAPTQRAKESLLSERIPENNIFITGNTVIDALLWTKNNLHNFPIVDNIFASAQKVFAGTEPIILVTGHRRESFGQGFENICIALQQIAHQHKDVHIVYPVHLNPNVREPVYRLLQHTPNIHLIPPLDYINFIRLMDRCHLILTDSGGIQEEAPSLHKPTLVMRDCTERPEGIDAGVVKLVGTNASSIQQAVSELLENTDAYTAMSTAKNPYGDGTTSQQILSILRGR